MTATMTEDNTVTSPASPSLTHASTTDGSMVDDFADSFLDPAAWSNADEAHSIEVAASGSEMQGGLFEQPDMQDLLAQYGYATDKMSFDMAEQPFSPPPTSTGAQFDFDPSDTIDPFLVESPFYAASPAQSHLEQSCSPDAAMTPAASSTATADSFGSDSKKASKGPVKKGATRATSASKSAPATKSKMQRVADLALPIPEADNTKTDLKIKDKDASGHLPHIVFPVPDYVDKPSAEEYSKMSSREKRQLRNKISARNFRHRRKEYITTLEEEIATRDTTISSLTEEVSLLKTENQTLRSDLDSLRKTLDDFLAKSRSPEPVLASTSSSLPSPSLKPTSASLKPNLAKDVAPFASSSNWGPGGFGALPNLNVHTTLVPSTDLTSIFEVGTARPSLPARKNMNPRMDGFDAAKDGFHLPSHQEDDTFFGSNPFILSSEAIEKYRAQLYGKLSHNLSNQKAPVAGFKPSFFAEHTPLSSPTLSTSDKVEREVEAAAARQTAYVACVAQNTLIRGLWSTFWNTFAGHNPLDAKHKVDAIASVLSGKSEFQIVPKSAAASSEDVQIATPVHRDSTRSGDRDRERLDELTSGVGALSVSSSGCLTLRGPKSPFGKMWSKE